MPCVEGIHTSQPERKALVFPLEDRPPTNSGHVPPQPGAKAAATRCPQPSPARGARSEADFRTDLWLPVSMLSMMDIVWWEVETAAPEKFMAFHRWLQGWTFAPAFEDSELDESYWIIRVGESGIGGLQRTSEGMGLPPEPGSISKLMTSKAFSHEFENSAARWNEAELPSAARTAGSPRSKIHVECLLAYGRIESPTSNSTSPVAGPGQCGVPARIDEGGQFEIPNARRLSPRVIG